MSIPILKIIKRNELMKALHLNKPKEIESAFVEIIETKNENVIIGCIYKHPKIPIK